MDPEKKKKKKPQAKQKAPTANGMPIGDQLTPQILPGQVTITEGGVKDAAFDDDAAGTIAWMDYQRYSQWLENNSWIMEWQAVDYLYQSPTYGPDYRTGGDQTARISRFNIAKNVNTMSTQVRRGIFAGTAPFILEPRGPLAGKDPKDVQPIIDAWTEILSVLSDRADLEYQMELFIQCMALQGTAIAVPGWEEKTVIRKTRSRKTAPVDIEQPMGGTVKVDTWESDDFKVREEQVTESWPYFEYRRLGTTLYDPKWRTPGRPDLTAGARIDIDFLNMRDVQQLRRLDCYDKIPSDEDLKKFWFYNPNANAEPGSQVAQELAENSTVVMHALNDNEQTSQDPTLRPMLRISRWTADRVVEVLCYEGQRLTIRNGEHDLDSHAFGYTGNWWNIENSGYGFGIGRLNSGDQRMDQGVLNEVLKMIAYPFNAPILYNKQGGNAPTQDVITDFGTFLGVEGMRPEDDVRKAFAWMEMPRVAPEAFQIYTLGKEGGEDLVGANGTTMQGNLGGPGSSAMRTASGVQRVGSKADEQISTPLAHVEMVLVRWYEFLYQMVLEYMPIQEIRDILSNKFGDAILKQINPETLLNAKFNLKILAGQKLAAKAQVQQLIPFLLSLVQQPQLMQFMHEKGWTINFLAIEQLYMQMSELQGRQDIIIPLSAEEKQAMQQSNPAAIKAQVEMMIEKLRGQNKIQELGVKGKQDMVQEILKGVMDQMKGGGGSGSQKEGSPSALDRAMGRVVRQNDVDMLRGGVA